MSETPSPPLPARGIPLDELHRMLGALVLEVELLRRENTQLRALLEDGRPMEVPRA